MGTDLTKMSIEEFAEALGSAAPIPGGGAAASLSAAMGASLLMMVANFTVGRSRYAEFEELNREVLEKAGELRVRFLEGIDRDAQAFSRVSDAYRLPDDVKAEAIASASEEAAAAPLAVMEDCVSALELADMMLGRSNPGLRSDILVAALQLHSGLVSAGYNVEANIPAIRRRSPETADMICARADEMREQAAAMTDRILSAG